MKIESKYKRDKSKANIYQNEEKTTTKKSFVAYMSFKTQTKGSRRCLIDSEISESTELFIRL